MLIVEIEANVSHMESLTHGLSEGQFNWRPEPGRWSIAECITHFEYRQWRRLGASGSRHREGSGWESDGRRSVYLWISIQEVRGNDGTRRQT